MPRARRALGRGSDTEGGRRDGAANVFWVDDDGLSVIDSGTVIDSIPIHPMGIKPLGNQYFEHGPNARQSTGIVGQLPDELIVGQSHLFGRPSPMF